jgi:hypothetical protein
MCCRIAMAKTTGILYNHRNVAQISAMPHCGFNADFHGNANDGKCGNAAIAQRDVQWRAFKLLLLHDIQD